MLDNSEQRKRSILGIDSACTGYGDEARLQGASRLLVVLPLASAGAS